MIYSNKELPTKEEEQAVHQLCEYYAELKKNAVKDSLIIENPTLKNPSVGGSNIPAL